MNHMKCSRSACDLTHCSVARLGSRWALTLAPHCVQLIWTRTACRTCWWELPCTASSGMRARCLCTSARATWVGCVGVSGNVMPWLLELFCYALSSSPLWSALCISVLLLSSAMWIFFFFFPMFNFFLTVFVILIWESNSGALRDYLTRRD